MDTLSLTGLQFYGHHGTESWEQEVGRRFSVDVEIEVDLTAAGRSDLLADAIDYRAVFDAVRYVMEEERHELIERIAWRILEEIFSRFTQAHAVRARVNKPEAPIGGINQAAVVDIKRTRHEWEQNSSE